MKIIGYRNLPLVGLILGLSWFAACTAGGAILLNFLYERMPELSDTLVPLYVALWITTIFLGRTLISNLLGLIVYGRHSPVTTTYSIVEHGTPWNIMDATWDTDFKLRPVGYFDQVQSTISAVDPIKYELGEAR